MTVAELMQQLQRYDPSLLVVVRNVWDDDEHDANELSVTECSVDVYDSTLPDGKNSWKSQPAIVLW